MDELPDIRSSILAPPEILVRKEQFARLRELISTLTPRQQEIVTLKFFAGLCNYEIADILNLNERTVASHLCQALKTLKETFQREVES